jgi:hypothetical protein
MLIRACLVLLDPQDIRALQRLDVMRALVTQAVKSEARAIAPDNLGLLDLVVRLEPEPLYLVLQELMNNATLRRTFRSLLPLSQWAGAHRCCTTAACR